MIDHTDVVDSKKLKSYDHFEAALEAKKIERKRIKKMYGYTELNKTEFASDVMSLAFKDKQINGKAFGTPFIIRERQNHYLVMIGNTTKKHFRLFDACLYIYEKTVVKSPYDNSIYSRHRELIAHLDGKMEL